jgi:sodium transport system permease protein
MRWSIVRVIWMRELRDQLRDRRTILMIAVLPLVLYPLGGLGFIQFAGGAGKRPQVVGVVGAADLPFFERDKNGLSVRPDYLGQGPGREPFVVRPLAVEGDNAPDAVSDTRFLARCRRPLDAGEVDLVIVVPPDFMDRLRDGGRPSLQILSRENDEFSRVVGSNFTAALLRWKKALRQERLAAAGLPPQFDDPFMIPEARRDKPLLQQTMDDLVRLLLRIFPFILVMWSLAGALYPAVDLCAGEKERGTMETLLISPASREEIVWGKFLTIWVFSAATALLNLLSMGVTAWLLGGLMHIDWVRPGMLFWSVLLLLPLSAFFSAVSLAVGAYARSSKEGQYYLMPLFLLTLPLVCVTLLPGVELNPLFSMIPVTGVALLLQRLLLPDPERGPPWLYFLPVLAPMVAYSWLALRWAEWQFRREEVLFREAERLDVGLWLRRLFREKEALPTAGEAFFCFGLLLALRGLSLGFGRDASLLGLTAVGQLAFTAAPPLFMALLLTTRPHLGLGLRRAPWWSGPAAALLAVLCVPPLAGLALLILDQFPNLKQLLEEHTLTGALQSGGGLSPWSLLVLAALPALCEELAFRGFILTGLLRRFGPWAAVPLSSFLFALFQMNVFQFVPHFVLGLVLGLLVVRAGSVVPAVVFHLVYNLLLVAPLAFPQALGDGGALGHSAAFRAALAVGCALLAAGLLAAMLRFGKRPAAAAETSGAEALATPNGAAAHAAGEPARPRTPA